MFGDSSHLCALAISNIVLPAFLPVTIQVTNKPSGDGGCPTNQQTTNKNWSDIRQTLVGKSNLVPSKNHGNSDNRDGSHTQNGLKSCKEANYLIASSREPSRIRLTRTLGKCTKACQQQQSPHQK